MKNWNKKPPREIRSVQDALDRADKLQNDLPNTVQVSSSDWDLVILADEVRRLTDHLYRKYMDDLLKQWDNGE